MAHFAKLDENNVVTTVLKVSNKSIKDAYGVEQEQLGVDLLRKVLNEPEAIWKKTSYNSFCGKYYIPNPDGQAYQDSNIHADQSKCFRKTYAGIGFIYYPDIDAFKTPQNWPSWVWNDTTWMWEAPITYPGSEDGSIRYSWDEDAYQADNTKGWILFEDEVENED
tara:strand:+ start:1517 stop:2011 length:495 start_codon:yes stop_codon:yes gene_type:complete